MTLKQAIEALVFASPKPLLTKEIVAALKSAGEETEDQLARDYAQVREAEVLAALAELQADYIQSGRAFQLAEQVNGWALVTDAAAAVWVRQLYPEAKPTRLSGPALETLAIIAYRQPVTRADIEAVRGVAVDGMMQVLLDRSLIKIAGRAEVPGRPLLYQTTEYFLQHFGLKNVDDLPNAGELKRVPLPTAPPPAEEPEKKPKGRKSKATPEAAPVTESAAENAAPEQASAADATSEPASEAEGDMVKATSSAPEPGSDQAAESEAPADEPQPETSEEP
jgi:segregation and condensation protein B